MSNSKISLISLFLLILCLGYSSVKAQTSKLVYICVAPTNDEEYLIQLSGMSLFGLVIPQDAEVTLYTPIEQPLIAAGYSITNDKQGIGYQRETKISTLYAGNKHAGDRTCTQDYLETRDMLSTIPFPISANHAILVQVGSLLTYDPVYPNEQPCNSSGILLDCQKFLGVFSVQLRPLNPTGVIFQRDFQFIQMVDGDMDIQLRFLSRILENNTVTRIIVIGNKFVVLSRKSIEQPDFASAQNADTRDTFVPELSSRPLTDADTNKRLNLFELMRESHAHIYPQFGLVYDYPVGGSIRLTINKSEASREFPLNRGDCIRPLPGTRANYFAPDQPDNVLGYLADATDEKPAEVAKINEIHENGEVRITDSQRQGDYVLEAPWWIESIPCPV